MRSSRISRRATPVDGQRTARRIVWWVGGWAGLLVIAHSAYLSVVLPMVDRHIVFFAAGKMGAGGAAAIVLDASPTAVVSTILAVLGVVGAGVAVALYRARPLNAHQVAVVSLALIACSLALDAAGLVAVVVDETIIEPGLAGGTPGIVATFVFVSQLVPLLAGGKGRHARATA